MSNTVTFGQARIWLSDIAASAPDKVAKCNYASEANDGTFDPDCIIGVMLHKHFHIDPEFLASLSTIFSACWTDALPYVDIDADALFFMCLVQALQDGAVCDQQNWHNSVTRAERAMALIDVTNGSYNLDNIPSVARYITDLAG